LSGHHNVWCNVMSKVTCTTGRTAYTHMHRFIDHFTGKPGLSVASIVFFLHLLCIQSCHILFNTIATCFFSDVCCISLSPYVTVLHLIQSVSSLYLSLLHGLSSGHGHPYKTTPSLSVLSSTISHCQSNCPVWCLGCN